MTLYQQGHGSFSLQFLFKNLSAIQTEKIHEHVTHKKIYLGHSIGCLACLGCYFFWPWLAACRSSQGQRSNPSQSSNQSHGSDGTQFLTARPPDNSRPWIIYIMLLEENAFRMMSASEFGEANWLILRCWLSSAVILK